MATLDYSPGVPVRPSAVIRAGQPHRRIHAGRAEPRVLHRLGFGSGRHLAEDGARLLAHPGQASKTRLIGREKGYHGVNFGGISVGGMAGNRKLFGQGVEADHLPHTQLKRTPFRAACRRRASNWPTNC